MSAFFVRRWDNIRRRLEMADQAGRSPQCSLREMLRDLQLVERDQTLVAGLVQMIQNFRL